MWCDCCGKKVKKISKDFRIDENGITHEYHICDECFELPDREFFEIYYRENDNGVDCS